MQNWRGRGSDAAAQAGPPPLQPCVLRPLVLVVWQLQHSTQAKTALPDACRGPQRRQGPSLQVLRPACTRSASPPVAVAMARRAADTLRHRAPPPPRRAAVPPAAGTAPCSSRRCGGTPEQTHHRCLQQLQAAHMPGPHVGPGTSTR